MSLGKYLRFSNFSGICAPRRATAAKAAAMRKQERRRNRMIPPRGVDRGKLCRGGVRGAARWGKRDLSRGDLRLSIVRATLASRNDVHEQSADGSEPLRPRHHMNSTPSIARTI